MFLSSLFTRGVCYFKLLCLQNIVWILDRVWKYSTISTMLVLSHRSQSHMEMCVWSNLTDLVMNISYNSSSYFCYLFHPPFSLTYGYFLNRVQIVPIPSLFYISLKFCFLHNIYQSLCFNFQTFTLLFAVIIILFGQIVEKSSINDLCLLCDMLQKWSCEQNSWRNSFQKSSLLLFLLAFLFLFLSKKEEKGTKKKDNTIRIRIDCSSKKRKGIGKRKPKAVSSKGFTLCLLYY